MLVVDTNMPQLAKKLCSCSERCGNKQVDGKSEVTQKFSGQLYRTNWFDSENFFVGNEVNYDGKPGDHFMWRFRSDMVQCTFAQDVCKTLSESRFVFFSTFNRFGSQGTTMRLTCTD